MTQAHWHYDAICPAGNQHFAIQFDLSRQQIMTLRRIGANGT